jgi:hypothetical protein
MANQDSSYSKVNPSGSSQLNYFAIPPVDSKMLKRGIYPLKVEFLKW